MVYILNYKLNRKIYILKLAGLSLVFILKRSYPFFVIVTAFASATEII